MLTRKAIIAAGEPRSAGVDPRENIPYENVIRITKIRLDYGLLIKNVMKCDCNHTLLASRSLATSNCW